MYPKICTHRNDHTSQVVVANAEQEAALPDEYRDAVTGTSGQTIAAADHAADVLLSTEYSAVLADREKLEADRLALASDRAALEKDRADLTAGYKASMEKLEADRAKLDEDQRLFDERKAGEQPTTAPAVDKVSDAPAAAATPAKRVRTAKAD